MKKKALILVLSLSIAFMLATPVFALPTERIEDYIKPGAKKPGYVTKVYTGAKVQQIPILAHIKPQELEAWETKQIADRALAEARETAAQQKAIAMTATIVRTNYVLSNTYASFYNTFNDIDLVVTEYLENQTYLGQSKEDRKAEARRRTQFAKETEDAIRTLLDNPEIAKDFRTNKDARRNFWSHLRVYDRYTESDINYINTEVIPALAMQMVSRNYNSSLTFWQALNGVDAEVACVPGTISQAMQGAEQLLFNESPQLRFYQPNSSVSVLGLLAQASAGLASGTGPYASSSSLEEYWNVLLIPEARKEDPKPTSAPAASVARYETIVWKVRLTK